MLFSGSKTHEPLGLLLMPFLRFLDNHYYFSAYQQVIFQKDVDNFEIRHNENMLMHGGPAAIFFP